MTRVDKYGQGIRGHGTSDTKSATAVANQLNQARDRFKDAVENYRAAALALALATARLTLAEERDKQPSTSADILSAISV